MSKIQIEQKLTEMIEVYYKTTNFAERGNIFFEIVDWYNYLREKDFKSDLMVVMQNIIVLG